MSKLKKIVALLALAGVSVNAQTITQTFGNGTNQFSIDFVTIGNPGNAADTRTYTGNFNSVGQSYSAGSVGYIYNLAKYEINREMINKANAVVSLGITMHDMSSLGGNDGQKPASGISWYEAAKFVNYLNTSQNKQTAYNFDVNGNFVLWATGQYNGSNQFRHKDAYYFLPSVDEWYKAAYGTPQGTWRDYATETGTAPVATGGGSLANTAVYGQPASAGPANIFEAGGLSGWGTVGQGGNLYEWMETAKDGQNNSPTEQREIRGGAWTFEGQASGGVGVLSSTFRTDSDPDIPNYNYLNTGFRVASVPEPSKIHFFPSAGRALRRQGAAD